MPNRVRETNRLLVWRETETGRGGSRPSIRLQIGFKYVWCLVSVFMNVVLGCE